MSLPRMTVRRWLMAVAMVALVFSGRRAYTHWSQCRWMADVVEGIEGGDIGCVRYQRGWESLIPDASRTPDAERELAAERARDDRARVARCAALKRAFRRAAWRPWEPVPELDLRSRGRIDIVSKNHGHETSDLHEAGPHAHRQIADAARRMPRPGAPPLGEGSTLARRSSVPP
jgi:hypothetical protein